MNSGLLLVLAAKDTESGFLSGFLLGVAVAVVGGLILAGLLYLIKHYWRRNPIYHAWERKRGEAADRRLLRAIRQRSQDNLDASVSLAKAAQQAEVEDWQPSVRRLAAKGYIEPHREHMPVYARITELGLRAPEAAETRLDRGARSA
jgi:hypothetical protein